MTILISSSPLFVHFLLLLPGYESESVVTGCVWLGRINNQTGCPSKTGKSSKRWMVYTNKNHVQYIHRTAALSFICVVIKAWQGMEFNLTLKSSREPASTTEDGTRFHSLMDLGKKEYMCPSWLWSVRVYGFLLFWSPLLCNSWLVQWQSADGGSCSTLQGFVSILFAGGIPIEDCLAGLLHSLGSCPGNSYRTEILFKLKVRLNALFMVSYCTKLRVGAASYKKMLML